MSKVPDYVMKAVQEVLDETQCEECDGEGFSITDAPKMQITGELDSQPLWVFKSACNTCGSICAIELIHKRVGE